jgi:3',5'-cyclic AMP phosphodiesterase CpdA
MPRIAFISDTHLTPRSDNENALRAIETVAALDVDLVINGGDISANGADQRADLEFALKAHERIRTPMAFIPGNHDIGEEPGALAMGQPIDAIRLARYQGVFGADRWARDLGAWRICAVNALLIGTGLAEEGEQGEWLMTELAQARGRRLPAQGAVAGGSGGAGPTLVGDRPAASARHARRVRQVRRALCGVGAFAPISRTLFR